MSTTTDASSMHDEILISADSHVMERIKEMGVDGVSAEVLYPTYLLPHFGLLNLQQTAVGTSLEPGGLSQQVQVRVLSNT